MKKILSVLLALLMLLSSMTLLVNATTPENNEGGGEGGAGLTATTEKVSGTSGHIFYSENFDGENLKVVQDDSNVAPVTDEPNDGVEYKTGNALLEALGWETTDNGNVQFSITEDGKLRIVTSAGASYATNLGQVKNMAGNAITIEYDFTFANTSAQSSYLSFNICADDNNYVRATPVTAAGTIDVGNMIFKGGSAQNMLENLIDLKIEKPFTEFAGRSHTMKCIIDPNSDGVLVYVDDVPMTNMKFDQRKIWTQYGPNASKSVNQVVGDLLNLVVTEGADVTIDNIRVSEYAPALQISEIMANARKSGEYQWLEIYNATDAPANIYDYCVVIYNGCVGPSLAGTIGDETDKVLGTTTRYYKDAKGNIVKITENTYNAWDKDAASTVGYFAPGEKKLLVDPKAEKEEDRYQTFKSPDLEDGKIAPGETAIVLLPYTAVQGGKSVSDTDFRTYLEKIGTPIDDDFKTFVCDNDYSRCGCTEYTYCERKLKDVNNTPDDTTDDVLEPWHEACSNPYKFPFRVIDELNESTMVALMKVENTATAEELEADPDAYKPVGIGVGKPNNQMFPYYENYVAMSSKGATSGTTVVGFEVRTTVSVADDTYPVGTIVYKVDNNGKLIPKRDENGNIVRDKNDEIVYDTEKITELPMKDEYVFNGHFGREAASFSATDDKSFEITYNRDGNESRAQRMGRMAYNATQLRPTGGTQELFYSPGYVPPVCRNGIAIAALNSLDESNEVLVAHVGADYEYDGEVPYGYEYVGMQVTDRKAVAAPAEVTPAIVQTIPAEMLTVDADLSVVLVFRRLIPEIVGYQVSTPVDGKYAIRVIGKTENIKCQTLGFRIEMTWVDKELGKQTVKYDRECRYVYDSLMADGHEYGENGKKLFAYHINNIPEHVKNLQITVTPYYVKGYADTTVYLATDSTSSFTVNEGVIYFEGEYEKHQDTVDFEYDKSRIPSPDM